MDFSYVYPGDTVDQGTLASSYTNALSSYLQTDGADYVAFLAYVAGGSTDVDAALAIKAAVEAGNFSLSGLFSAAQNKTGGVDGEDIPNPTPILTVTVGETTYTIDLTAMLGTPTTESWDTVVKKATITHTREFYSTGGEPGGYTGDWADPQVNEAPTANQITIDDAQEYDDYAVAHSEDAGDRYITIDLLADANAFDPEGQSLSIIIDENSLPTYASYDADTGILTIDTDDASLDYLKLGDELPVTIEYQISDGVNTIDNQVNLTITGTADQFKGSTTITVTKIGEDAVTTSGSYDLLGFDWSNVTVDVTGTGDYDRNTEGFTVTTDVSATYAGTATTGNAENSFISVNPTETLASNWSDDGDLDYTVSFTGAVDGYTEAEPDASTVSIALSYDYWM